jgi:hypothetical protein
MRRQRVRYDVKCFLVPRSYDDSLFEFTPLAASVSVLCSPETSSSLAPIQTRRLRRQGDDISRSFRICTGARAGSFFFAAVFLRRVARSDGAV